LLRSKSGNLSHASSNCILNHVFRYDPGAQLEHWPLSPTDMCHIFAKVNPDRRKRGLSETRTVEVGIYKWASDDSQAKDMDIEFRRTFFKGGLCVRRRGRISLRRRRPCVETWLACGAASVVVLCMPVRWSACAEHLLRRAEREQMPPGWTEDYVIRKNCSS
jgi:hypothetical protein